MKVVIFCGGLGVRMGEETQRIPKPMIRDRQPADPLAHHAVLRRLGAQRVHPLPRLQGRRDQGVLPQLQRGARQRLRARRLRRGRERRAPRTATSATGGSRSSTPGAVDDRRAAEGSSSRISATTRSSSRPTATASPTRRSPASIERFDGVGEDRRCSCRCGRTFNAHLVEADERRHRPRGRRTMSTSDVRINGGFFVLRREIFDWIEPGDELVEETFARLIPRGEVGRVPLRRLLRADGHDQGPAAARGAARVRAGRPWRRVGLDAAESPVGVMLRSRLAAGDAPVRRVLAIGAHSDDIEIGCGGTLLALTRAQPGRSRCTGSCSPRPGDRGDEARASAEAFLDARPRVRRRGPRLPRRVPPARGRRGEGRVRGARRRGSTRTSSSRTRATTSTRTTASSAS